MKRTGSLVSAALAGVLLLSGCGEGPVRSGAAATVGDTRIETGRLAGVVERALRDEQAAEQFGTDRTAFQRQVLSRLITGRLLGEAARREGVEVTEAEVQARRQEFATQLGGEQALVQQAAQSGIAAQDLDAFLHDITLNDELGDRLTAGEQVPAATLRELYQQNLAQFDQVRARHILLRTQAEAQQVLATLRRDPSQFGRLASERSLDEGSKPRGGELDPAGRGTYVPEFEQALFSARPGQLGVVQTQFGFHVYQLLERRTTTLAQATPLLRRQALAEQREAAVGDLLREVAGDLGVRVNPRFGRWDRDSVQVVEADSELSSPAPDGDAADGEVLQPQGEQPQGEQPPGGQPPVEQPQDEVPSAQ